MNGYDPKRENEKTDSEKSNGSYRICTGEPGNWWEKKRLKNKVDHQARRRTQSAERREGTERGKDSWKKEVDKGATSKDLRPGV